jgi:hypothetical protein
LLKQENLQGLVQGPELRTNFEDYSQLDLKISYARAFSLKPSSNSKVGIDNND